MLNFCVVTSHKEISSSVVTSLRSQLNAKRVDVLGSCGVQFQVESETASEKLALESRKKIDINFITEDERSVHLLASDMDGTILEEECIDEIADLVGKGSEVRSITALAMKEGLNFDEALQRRLAFLRGTELEVLEYCLSKKITIRPGAAVLFKTFKKYFGETAILSGGFTYFSDHIQKELEADFAFANILECKENRLTGKVLGTIVNAEKKTELMKQLIARQGKNSFNVVAVGDGNNDIRMISESGVGISFKGSPQLNLSAKHVLKNSDISAILYLLGLREEQFVY
tara:strand:- start:867 stop:1727 length:861 start_codon:yes stop_codon:yes gene_type:complete